MDLQPELELLLQLADAYFTPDPRTGKRTAIERYRHMGGATIGHHALPADQSIDDEEVHWLEGQGYVQVEDLGQHSESIRVTPEGEHAASALRRLEAQGRPDDDTAVSLEWEGVARPTLEAAYRVWGAHGAPREGIPTGLIAEERGREEGDPETYRAVALLEDRGYLGAPSTIFANDAPALVTVTSLGLEVVGGWPATTAEAASAALLAALDQEIEVSDEPGERGRLLKLREAAVEVGTGTLTQVLAHLIKGGV